MSSKVNKARKYNSIGRKTPIYRHPWLYIVLVIIVAATVFGIWFAFFRPQNTETEVIDTSDNTIGSVPSETKAQGKDAEKEDENAATGKKQTPAQYDGEDPNQLDEITGYISYSAVNYDHYTIRLTLNQYLTSGTCELTMKSGNNTVTKTAEVINSASTSTCQGFDIPLSELPSGDWSVKIKVAADNKTGTITGGASL